jgi:REP element-mobilizing transposase RayT
MDIGYGDEVKHYAGDYYHVFQRGNHKNVVFQERADKVRFLSKLEEYCDRDNQAIMAYCLMDNHYHLALRQNGTRDLSRTMASLLQGYAKFYNSKYGTAGHLFQVPHKANEITPPRYNPWS